MKRFLLICAALVAALSFASPSPVLAGGEQEKSVYGNWPSEMNTENPHAAPLAEVRKRLDTAIARFWDVYARDPWNYWVVVDAYYDYAESYQRYVWTLWRYWQWENTHYRFSGRVLTRDIELSAPIDANAKVAPEPEKIANMPREMVVPNATIKLERNVMFLAGQPLAQQEEAKAAAEKGESIAAPIPPAGYTKTTDDRGRFDFRGLPRGQYRFVVSAPGFFPQSGLVEIAATRQDRDIFLIRFRKFEGVVFTVTADCLPILRPLLAKSGTSGGAVDVASADEVEKILGSDQRIAAQFRRLVPVDGARVTLSSNLAMPMPGAPGGLPTLPGQIPMPGQTPGQIPTIPGQVPTVPGQTPGQLPTIPGQVPTVPGQLPTVPGQLPTAPGQTPGQLPPLPGIDDKASTTPAPAIATSTAADGRFSFRDLGQTSYRVSVEKAGYLPFNALINLERAHTWRRVVIFPFVPFEPGKAEPQKVEQNDVSGKSLNDPFAK